MIKETIDTAIEYVPPRRFWKPFSFGYVLRFVRIPFPYPECAGDYFAGENLLLFQRFQKTGRGGRGDGFEFEISVQFEKCAITARGSGGKFPPRYDKFHQQMIDFFLPILGSENELVMKE